MVKYCLISVVTKSFFLTLKIKIIEHKPAVKTVRSKGSGSHLNDPEYTSRK
jgi:hypothetical protein